MAKNNDMERLFTETVRAGLQATRSYIGVASMTGCAPLLPDYFRKYVGDNLFLSPIDEELNARVKNLPVYPLYFLKDIPMSEHAYSVQGLSVDPMEAYCALFLTHPVHVLASHEISPPAKKTGTSLHKMMKGNLKSMLENVQRINVSDPYYNDTRMRPSPIETRLAETHYHLDNMAHAVQMKYPNKKFFFSVIERNKKDLTVLTENYRELAHSALLHLEP